MASLDVVLDSADVASDVRHVLLILFRQFVNLAFKLLLVLLHVHAESIDRFLDLVLDR